MTIGSILRERRKAAGLTQEQVGNYLGVSTPAVNKWERGITCPDIALLPALARLLKTDPNTLLAFQGNLSKEEITRFLNEAGERIKSDGVEQGFAMVAEKVQEYPNCIELIHSAALLLDGTLIMSGLSEQQKEPYKARTFALYERVAKSGDPLLSIRAKYMLASKLIHCGEYDKAQEYLDELPEWNALDKRGMQATVWGNQGETAKAAELLENKLQQSLQDQQMTLCQLIRLSAREGGEEASQAFAECARKECEAFHLNEYWANIAPLEAAVARKDTAHSIEALAAMLEAGGKPWNSRLSPLFVHLPNQESTVEFNRRFLSPLLTALEQAPEYDFLRGTPEFTEMIRFYREKYGIQGEEQSGGQE